MAVGITAIKTDDPEKVLDLASEYYSKYNLELAEIVVGGGDSKFVKKRYETLEGFRSGEHNDIPQEINTHFDFYFNLEENREWVAFHYEYQTFPAEHNITINLALAKYISENLGTQALEYFNIDKTGFTFMRRIKGGERVDQIVIKDSMRVYLGYGYFEKFEDKDFEDATQVYHEILQPYFSKLGFDPRSEDFMYFYKDSWRHFYLEGPREDLEDFIKNKQSSL